MVLKRQSQRVIPSRPALWPRTFILTLLCSYIYFSILVQLYRQYCLSLRKSKFSHRTHNNVATISTRRCRPVAKKHYKPVKHQGDALYLQTDVTPTLNMNTDTNKILSLDLANCTSCKTLTQNQFSDLHLNNKLLYSCCVIK